MTVQVLRDEKFRKEYEVTLSGEEILKEKEAWILANAKDMRIDGFRPGKAPLKILMKNYGEQAHEKAVNKLLTTKIDALVEEHKLKDAELKKVDQVNKTSESEVYKTEFSVPPQFDLIASEKITVENLKLKVSDKFLNRMIEFIQLEKGERTDYNVKDEHAIQGDDAVYVTVQIYENDVLINDSKENYIRIIMDTSESDPCMTLIRKNIMGHKINDVVTVDNVEVKDAEGYFNIINGKKVKLILTINEIVSIKKAELNEKLFEKYGLKSLDELKEWIANKITETHASEIETCHKRYVLDALDKAYTFELAAEDVDNEFKKVWDQFLTEKKEFEAKGKTHPDMEGKKEKDVEKEYKKVAERRIRLSHILSRTAVAEKIRLSENDLLDYVKKYVGPDYSSEAQNWSHYMANDKHFRRLYLDLILENKITLFLHSKAKHKDIDVSQEELAERYANVMP